MAAEAPYIEMLVRQKSNGPGRRGTPAGRGREANHIAAPRRLTLPGAALPGAALPARRYPSPCFTASSAAWVRSPAPVFRRTIDT